MEYPLGFLEVFAFFWGGGGGGYIWGEHSVEDHCLHINGIIFGGYPIFFFWGGGDSPSKQASRKPWPSYANQGHTLISGTVCWLTRTSCARSVHTIKANMLSPTPCSRYMSCSSNCTYREKRPIKILGYNHRRMGTLWLGGAEGLICPKFYTDNHKHPPLGHCPHDVIHPPKIWKLPLLLDIHKHTPPWTLPVWRHHPHSKGVNL